MLCVGVLFGTVEVSMVAFAEERGSDVGGGLLLAMVAGGSAVAGLLYGAVHWKAPLHRRFPLSLVGLAALLLPLLLAPSVALMAPTALLAGIAISPSLIGAFGLVDSLVPAGARTEGVQLAQLGARRRRGRWLRGLRGSCGQCRRTDRADHGGRRRSGRSNGGAGSPAVAGTAVGDRARICRLAR